MTILDRLDEVLKFGRPMRDVLIELLKEIDRLDQRVSALESRTGAAFGSGIAHQCEGTVLWSNARIGEITRRCRRAGMRERDGHWFCKDHDPERRRA